MESANEIKNEVSNDDPNKCMQVQYSCERIELESALMQVSNPVKSGEGEHQSETVDRQFVYQIHKHFL